MKNFVDVHFDDADRIGVVVEETEHYFTVEFDNAIVTEIPKERVRHLN